MKQYNRSNITEEPIISPVDPCGGRVCDECEIGGCDHGIESELNPELKAQMERNRSNVVDADQSWKLRYLDQLRESRETGKPLSEVINADKHPADHIRVQNQIKKIIDAEQHRFKLRDLK